MKSLKSETSQKDARSDFRALWNTQDGILFMKIVQRFKAINFYCKKLHLSYLTGLGCIIVCHPADIKWDPPIPGSKSRDPLRSNFCPLAKIFTPPPPQKKIYFHVEDSMFPCALFFNLPVDSFWSRKKQKIYSLKLLFSFFYRYNMVLDIRNKLLNGE